MMSTKFKRMLRAGVVAGCVAAMGCTGTLVYAEPSTEELEEQKGALEDEVSSLNNELNSLGSDIEELSAKMEEAIQTDGLLGLFTGGFTACAAGVSGALIFSYLASLIFKPKMKS